LFWRGCAGIWDLSEGLYVKEILYVDSSTNYEGEITTEKLRKGYGRYEKLRRLNPRQFADLWQSNLNGVDSFDDLVDKLP
jgi:hypothetical protein